MFREVVGTTPHRYLVERRVAHAARLLATGDIPVTDICFDSGFGSVARFQAAFRRAWGVTPSQVPRERPAVSGRRRPPATVEPSRRTRASRTFRAARRSGRCLASRV